MNNKFNSWSEFRFRNKFSSPLMWSSIEKSISHRISWNCCKLALMWDRSCICNSFIRSFAFISLLHRFSSTLPQNRWGLCQLQNPAKSSSSGGLIKEKWEKMTSHCLSMSVIVSNCLSLSVWEPDKRDGKTCKVIVCHCQYFSVSHRPGAWFGQI